VVRNIVTPQAIVPTHASASARMVAVRRTAQSRVLHVSIPSNGQLDADLKVRILASGCANIVQENVDSFAER
jgi:hypothetical protein